ncbi:MAG TPA: cytochrome b/b6 domain-containing protein, partial [Candidatus Competibacteraceae bacterium]|nr:cytochrome b/b6 domain-containing protein [Candidatus Competibacteraceae bacterium]
MTKIPRYTLIQRLLHWLIALLALLTLGIGMTLGFLGFDGVQETFGKAATNAFYTGHKTFGVLILALMLLRLGV